MIVHVAVPCEPTLEMCIAYLRAMGYSRRDVAAWSAYLQRNLGGPRECGFVAGLRAAIAAGAGFPVDQVVRGTRPAATVPKRSAA